MAIVRTLDVFCDWPSCRQWTHGDVGHNPTVRRARAVATRAGWAAGRREDGQLKDFCPEHK